MLAEGADPNSSPELARRAAQLRSLRHRRALAAAIERAIAAADHPGGGLTSAVRLQRREILATRARLAQLATDLAGGDRGSVSVKRPGLLRRTAAATPLKGMTPVVATQPNTEEVEHFAVRGLALVQRLLTDGDSPLYTFYQSGELELAVRHASAALHLR